MVHQEIILASKRVRIRSWGRNDYYAMDRWPPFDDVLSLIWNLPQGLSFRQETWNKPDIRRAYAVEDIEGELIGRISLREIDLQNHSARLGITFGSPFVGQGLGTEALARFLDAYFDDMGFETMLLDVAAPNIRAVRSYRKLGFLITGRHWRDAGEQISRRLRDQIPQELEQYFRWGRRSLWIEFYDMELNKAEWLEQRSRITDLY